MGSAAPPPSIHVIVCGAGIAGLCTGLGVAQQGHKVTILESHAIEPVGIGLHVPPNATLVLERLGILDKMADDAILPAAHTFRRAEDSSIIASAPAPGIKDKNAHPYWTVRRADYQRHLYEAAVAAGCDIRLHTKVVSANEDVESVSLTLADGETVKGDLVVAADGVKSNLRALAIPEEDVSMALSPLASYRAFVQKSALLADPITAPYFSGEQCTIVWTTYNRHLIIYPSSDESYTINATHPASSKATAMDWSNVASNDEVAADFQNFDPVVPRIIHHAKDIKQWRLAEIARLPRWTSPHGRIVLCGDSAHAMLPFLAQGAAMATEDAASIAECLSDLQTSDEIPSRMRAYERARKWRCETVQAQTRRNMHMLHMPEGEERENRDRAFKGQEQTGIWTADTGPWVDAKFRKMLYEHNVIEHTRQTLRDMGLCQTRPHES